MKKNHLRLLQISSAMSQRSSKKPETSKCACKNPLSTKNSKKANLPLRITKCSYRANCSKAWMKWKGAMSR